MISSKLQQHFIQRKLRKRSLQSSVDTQVSSAKKMYSVGILTKDTFSGTYNLQEVVTEKLELKNPKIYSLRKFEKNQEKSYKHFSEKDLNWKGDILEPSLQGFVDEPFDLLICYFDKPNILLNYIATLSKASFKVGFAGVNTTLYSIEIVAKSNQVDSFFQETKKYLKILNKL